MEYVPYAERPIVTKAKTPWAIRTGKRMLGAISEVVYEIV